MNVVIIAGEVTRIRHNTTSSDRKVSNLGVKVTRKGKDRDFSDYFDVTKWGGVEGINEGDHVIVQGRLGSKKHWKQDSEGKDIWTAEIDASQGAIHLAPPTLGEQGSSAAPAGSDRDPFDVF